MIHPRTLALAAALGFSAAAFAAQPVYLGSEFQVNATSSGSQIAPAVAAGDGEGSFFAVWQKKCLFYIKSDMFFFFTFS